MQHLPRSLLMPVAMFVSGALCVLAYSYLTREPAAAPSRASASRPLPSPAAALKSDEPARTETPPAPSDESAADAPAPESVSSLTARITDPDPAKRAAAIAALADVPRDEAIPVLQRLVETGDDSERPLALSSLRALAQKQGDDDDRIRSVVRHIVYHASDEASTQAAQTTLAAIEGDLSAPNARRER